MLAFTNKKLINFLKIQFIFINKSILKNLFVVELFFNLKKI